MSYRETKNEILTDVTCLMRPNHTLDFSANNRFNKQIESIHVTSWTTLAIFEFTCVVRKTVWMCVVHFVYKLCLRLNLLFFCDTLCLDQTGQSHAHLWYNFNGFKYRRLCIAVANLCVLAIWS